MMFRGREKSFALVMSPTTFGETHWPTLKEEKSLEIFYVLHLKANNAKTYNNAWSLIMFNFFWSLIKKTAKQEKQ